MSFHHLTLIYVILTKHAAPLNRPSFIMMTSYTCLFTNLISLIFIKRTYEHQSFDPFRDLFLVFWIARYFLSFGNNNQSLTFISHYLIEKCVLYFLYPYTLLAGSIFLISMRWNR